jgi:hypothetical protein
MISHDQMPEYSWNKEGLKDTDQPWKEYRDIDATQEVVQQMLAGGTPDWVKWPNDYKDFAKEEFQKHREISETLALDYQLEDQRDLTNRAARMVNPMGTDDFVQKLRAFGIKCFTVMNGFPEGTVALWCLPPKQNTKARYICYLQIPAMYEWSVLRVDTYGKPIGEVFRGWRTAIVQLVEKEILTEMQADKIFGKASQSTVFSRYHRSLWEARNHRRYTAEQLVANDF